ncbi:nitroreductase [Pseudomonas monteilii]|uniref:nitroreductase family protein n=1 Tax=Pseudomonas monteilii TaxID=76759 RepID=UPI0015FD5C36|nr:nitroreductase [Pseudomonas monteilii]MBA6090617.1 nitroreductase [Pseudomonas monteilii]
MNIYEAIRERRSTRAFTAEPVEQHVIVRLIEAAVQAPSAMNLQPWVFTVVRDEVLLQQISSDAKKCLAKNCGEQMPESLQAMLDNERFQIFYHAPALIVIAAKTVSAWAVEDCALAAQNLMLAAHAEGLGSCWIGLAQRYLATPAGKQALHLPDECATVAPVIVGYPRSVPADVQRKAPEIYWIG